MASLQNFAQKNINSIEAVQKGDRLVVDSRLVADNLGIEHSSFFRTIKRYQKQIEQRFPLIRFEVEAVKKQGQRGTKYHEFAWLDEDQAMFLMTLSRNTDQVVECKANLVEAFSKARKMIPTLVDDNEALRMEMLRLQVELERERNRGKELDSTMIQLHGDRIVLALRGKDDVIVEKETIITEVVNPSEGTATKILSADQLKRAVKDRTGQRIKTAKEFTENLRKKGRDDLLVPVTRSQTCEYVAPDKLEEAIAVVFGKCRQKLIGE